jgi:hypothetical protein
MRCKTAQIVLEFISMLRFSFEASAINAITTLEGYLPMREVCLLARSSSLTMSPSSDSVCVCMRTVAILSYDVLK